MKNRYTLHLVIFMVSTVSFSQESKFSLELNYAIPSGDNFINKNYSGVIEIGAKYRFAEAGLINIGGSFNVGLLSSNSNLNDISPGFKVRAYTFQPRLFGELDVETLEKFHPWVGLGYSVVSFRARGFDPLAFMTTASESESGFNYQLGIGYDIIEKLFFQAQYDFIKLNKDDQIPETKFNTNVSFFKVGLGYRF